MYGLKIKNYAGDIKFLLFLLGIVVITVMININYFFSEDTVNEVKVIKQQELKQQIKDVQVVK